MGGNLGVPCRSRQPSVTEQYLDDADVGASLEQMRRKTVPQGVDGDRLAQFGLAGRLPAGFL